MLAIGKICDTCCDTCCDICCNRCGKYCPWPFSPLLTLGGGFASVLGFQGGLTVPAYSASRHGVLGLTKALANEWAAQGVNVNAIAPGPTDTALLESFDPSGKLAEAIIKQTPLKKLATPDEIASAICFLASADAGHITGQVLSVSGGLTMV